ncbi:MAG TPA: NADH-quinone oxidoreductase subunit C [Croceibacterium sp.]|nr:NADH-quinone oxidoreductase subunit C [Croceibacterium sp.]
MATVLHSAPRFASNEGVKNTLAGALGAMLLDAKEEHGEIVLTVERDRIEDALRLLRDEHDYQQLMEIAGVDFPSRPERFEVVYMLLSLTKNHRIMVKVTAAERTPVPTVTTLWPVAGWLEREVFDLFGVVFDGNTDLRRILTDYGFEGHPFRKDFPLTGYQEVRYSEEHKRVVYQPVDLPQDFRSFEFMSPWEGADYVLPGDEKAEPVPPAPNARPMVEPSSGKTSEAKPETRGPAPVEVKKATDKPEDVGYGEVTDKKAAKKVARGSTDATIAGQGHGNPTPETTSLPDPGVPDPTEDRPAKRPRKSKASDSETPPEPKPRSRRKKTGGDS